LLRDNDGMCNRYRPVSVTVVRDVFGFTLLEQPQPLYAIYPPHFRDHFLLLPSGLCRT